MVIERDVRTIVMLNSLYEYDRLSEYDESHFYNHMTKRHRQNYLPLRNDSFDWYGEECDIRHSSRLEGSIIRHSASDDEGIYWPCGENYVKKLKNGISLRLLNSRQQGSINIRFDHD